MMLVLFLGWVPTHCYALIRDWVCRLVKYFLDYKEAEKPRDAMNCDICRNCVTFDTADDLAAVR